MQPKKKINYMWVMVFVCFMLGFFCLGFCSGNKSLYLGAITEALGIDRGLFSINDSCRFIAQAVINLFFGALLYKFGIRKMTAFGFLALIGSMLIFGTIGIFRKYICAVGCRENLSGSRCL